MVKKGLKAGETFVDGGLPYVVVKVLPNGNYISKRIEKIPEEKSVETAENEAQGESEKDKETEKESQPVKNSRKKKV